MIEAMTTDRSAAHRAPSDHGRRRKERVARRPARYELSEPLRAFLSAKYLPVESPDRRTERMCAVEGTGNLVSLGQPVGAIRRHALNAFKLLALAATAALFVTIALVGEARADSVMLAEAGPVFGTNQTGQWSFTTPGSGQLDVTLTNFAWPTTTLPSLTLDIMSGSNLLQALQIQGGQSTTQNASATLSLAAGGTYYAYLFGNAGSPMNYGAYALVADFIPSQVAPVPLPASITLLLAGLATTAWSMRRRRSPSWRAMRKKTVTVAV